MSVQLKNTIEEIIALSENMLSGDFGHFGADHEQYLTVVLQNAKQFDTVNLFDMTLHDLSQNSHDLRQMLTSVVGYSAILLSPKISRHDRLSEQQLAKIETLHALARHIHWRLDGLILFASQITRPPSKTQLDMGMLNLGGYIQTQAEHFVCREHIQAVNITDNLPNVYANDPRTKLMLRGLLTAAVEMSQPKHVQINVYTVMQMVRARILIHESADKLPQIQNHNETQEIKKLPALLKDRTEKPLRDFDKHALRDIGLEVAINLADKQNSRVKIVPDGNHLAFMLTMPTNPSQVSKIQSKRPVQASKQKPAQV